MRKRSFILIVSGFLAAVLIFSGVMFGLSAARRAKAVLSYGGETVDAGEYRFFFTYYKGKYMSLLRAAGVSECADDLSFWQSTDPTSGETYGDLLSAYAERQTRATLVAAALYDGASGYSARDRERVREALSELVEYRAGGDRTAFDQMLAPYGFDYRDLSRATALLYRAGRALSALYGANGEIAAKDTAACESYYRENYVAVKLLVIRSEDTFLLDDAGNRRKDEGGNDILRALTGVEKEARAKDLSDIRQAIANTVSQAGGAMSETYFDLCVEKYKSENPDHTDTGYYFAKNADYTEEFSKKFASVTEKALTLSEGECAEVATDIGIFFLLRVSAQDEGYASLSLADFFEDFYTDLSEKRFAERLDTEVGKVAAGKTPVPDGLLSLPYNTEFAVRF